MFERQKKFTINGKSFIAQFPNVGQLIDLESLKQALTNNRYGIMAASGIASMYYALDIVDAISFYQICVPSLSKHYDIKNYTTLYPDEVKDLVEAYQNEIKPWFDGILMEIRGVVDLKDDGGNKTEDGQDA